MNKRIPTTVLCVAMLAAYGCGGQENVPERTSAPETSGEVTTEQVYSRENMPDSLPDDLNFGGEKFTIHCFDQNAMEWIAEGENGDIINDSIYRRNRAVEDRLGVNLDFYHAGALTDYSSVTMNALRSSILAGSGEFDLVAGYAAFITRGMGGYLTNLYDVKYLDFDKPWWISNMADEMTVNDRMYYMTGDIGLTVLRSFDACFFNSQIAEDYKLGDLFDIYNEGKWTIDEMRRCVVAVTDDLNGDGKTDADGSDRIGLFMFDRASGLDGFLGGARLRVTEKNDSGIPEISVNNERTISLLEKLTGLFSENGSNIKLMIGYPKAEETGLNLFSSGKLLFFNAWMKVAENESFRNMQDDWGILPYPKLDENQEKYGVFVCDSYSLFCIPIDCKDIDRAGAVTEALAAESYRHVTESYYSVALQSKYARSDESIKVLDDMRESVYMDFGYNYTGIGASYVVRDIISGKRDNFASWYAAMQDMMDNALETELTVYLE